MYVRLHVAAKLIGTAELLERAHDREARIVALDIPDREAILRVLEDFPEEMLELRATLLTGARVAAARRTLIAGSVGGCTRGVVDLLRPAAGGVGEV